MPIYVGIESAYIRKQNRGFIYLNINNPGLHMDLVHEIAHHLLHELGFTPNYFIEKGAAESEYEAAVWSVGAKFHNNRHIWISRYVWHCGQSYRRRKGDACWLIYGLHNNQHRKCCGLCNKLKGE